MSGEGGGELQFDSVVSKAAAPDVAASTGITCAGCRRVLEHEYYDVNGSQVCSACRDIVRQRGETARGAGVLVRAIVCGIVAAIAGAVVYYAVIALTNFEIGIVAILIGYMVGYAIHWATGGRGGRRFQIAALVLTYWAVGLAYTPLAVKELMGDDRKPAADASAPALPTAAAPAGGEESGDRSIGVSLVLLAGFTFALPVLVVFGSLPGGLISAFIIGIGMRQAWRMTGVPQLAISGPYRIGAVPQTE